MHDSRVLPKRLFIRLSSLGDVILASASLWTSGSAHSENHWLTATDFKSLFEAHPRVQKLWTFDRKHGFKTWWKLIQTFNRADFDEVIDLHRNLRTTLLVTVIRVTNCIRLLTGQKRVRIRRISKERFKQGGFYLFKALWPKALRPTPWTKRFSLAAGGTGAEKPSFKHLVDHDVLTHIEAGHRDGVAIMPASAWSGKLWQNAEWVSLIESIRGRMPNAQISILGTERDQASVGLARACAARPELRVSDQIGKISLHATCSFLARQKFLFCVDTGLGHLAESVGTPVVMAFGPTHPDLGFQPWQSKSGCAQSSLWCRPCSKDGTKCFRVVDRFRCMKEVKVEDFTRALDH